MIDYDIIFHKGQTFKLRDVACFSQMYMLKESLGHHFPKESRKLVITKDWRRVDRDTVSYLQYYPKISKSLTSREVRKYISYLYYHRGWGQYILNKGRYGIEKDGIMVDATGYGEHMLGVLQAVRYLEEKSIIVRTFNKLMGKGFNINPDMSFILSHFIKFDGENITTYNPFGHALINRPMMNTGTLIKYATSFPYPPLSKVKYNDILDPRRIHEYMATTSDKRRMSLENMILKCKNEKGYINKKMLINSVNQLQKEVDNVNEKKSKQKSA